ncbi:MAG: GNAT family N-acetyltransferase [Candidatus Krumholzibacteriia bacterium]
MTAHPRTEEQPVEPYRIRPATPADLDVVLHHRRRMFEDMGYADPDALTAMVRVSSSLIGEGLADGSYRGWLAETGDGSIVAGGGVMILRYHPNPLDPRPHRAWVVNMFTEPAHRRRGLARRLLDTIVGWCREEKMVHLYLHASRDGRPLYESLGFRSTNEMRLTL